MITFKDCSNNHVCLEKLKHSNIYISLKSVGKNLWCFLVLLLHFKMELLFATISTSNLFLALSLLFFLISNPSHNLSESSERKINNCKIKQNEN